jgi:MIP family channel proteins
VTSPAPPTSRNQAADSDAALERVPLAHRVGAEFIGTFALVFAGAGAIVISADRGNAISHEGIAATFGLVIMVMIYATGHISGAHFNPGVTLAFAVARRFPQTDVPAYWAAQFGGALAAATLLRALFGNIASLGATLPAGAEIDSFVLEIVLTFFLMFVIMAVATDTRAAGQAAAIAIGGTVGLAAMFAGPISGASMNSARSLGPALASGELSSIWIYLVAPPIGAILGALAYELVRGEQR